jgi:DNA polymerase-3 subunit epsilon
MREVCLDIETTGLDPKDGHKIIEIACVELVNKIKTGSYFQTYINPRREVPFDAFKIHGISTEFLQDKPIFDHSVDKFLSFIDGATLVIHNAAFDMKFINFELSLLGRSIISFENIIDSLLIARKKFPGAQNSLDALCRRFSIDLSKRKKHGALLDTELLADMYVELMGGLQSGIEFQAKNSTTNRNISSDVAKKEIMPSRDFVVSDEDLESHRKFITENFKTNFWGY